MFITETAEERHKTIHNFCDSHRVMTDSGDYKNNYNLNFNNDFPPITIPQLDGIRLSNSITQNDLFLYQILKYNY